MSENVREVLEDAFAIIHPKPSEDWKTWDNARVAEQRPEDQAAFTLWNDWRMTTRRRFTRFLDAEAYTDAALMLVPEDYDWIVARTNGGLTIHALVGTSDINKAEFGDHPALAIAQAALAAKGTGDE